MQKNNSFSIFRLFLVVTLLISTAINLLLAFKYLQLQNQTKDFTEPSFSLADPNGEYLIEKGPLGYYAVVYKHDGQRESALIGSAQLPLDQFENKKIRIQGSFRKILGAPTCFEKCEGNFRAPVIDIQNVYVVE